MKSFLQSLAPYIPTVILSIIIGAFLMHQCSPEIATRTISHDTIWITITDTLPAQVILVPRPFPVSIIDTETLAEAQESNIAAWATVDSLAAQSALWRRLRLQKRIIGADYSATLVCEPWKQAAQMDPFDGTQIKMFTPDTVFNVPAPVPTFWDDVMSWFAWLGIGVAATAVILAALKVAGVM